MLNTGSVAALTLEGIRKLVGDEFGRYELEFSQFLNTNQADKGTMTDREVVGIGTLTSKAQNAAIALTDPRVGRSRDYVAQAFAGGIRVSWEAEMDELYGFIRKHMGTLGQAANETLNIETAGIIDRGDEGDSPSILGFDGEELFHNTHTNLDGGDTLTYKDNRLQLDVSESALQTVVTQFQKVRDASDNRVNVGPATSLFHTPDDWLLIREIVESSGKPFTPDNTTNVLRGQITPKMLHYVTDADRWFVQAARHDMNFFMRAAPVVDSYDDKATKSTVSTIALRFTFGFGDWRGVIGSAPA